MSWSATAGTTGEARRVGPQLGRSAEVPDGLGRSALADPQEPERVDCLSAVRRDFHGALEETRGVSVAPLGAQEVGEVTRAGSEWAGADLSPVE